MDREIKFRAWNTQLKKMYFVGDEYGTTHNYDILIYQKEGQPIIPMQYTGLNDKHKSELYHSDLITNNYRNGGKPHEIIWSTKYGGWCGKYGNLEYLIADELDDITKVDNIYSNPELIEELK